MGMEAGHIVIDNLHLLTSKVGVLIQDDLVLLTVLWMEGWEVGGAPCLVTGCLWSDWHGTRNLRSCAQGAFWS